MRSQKRFPASVEHPPSFLDVRQISEELLPAKPLSFMVFATFLFIILDNHHTLVCSVSHLFAGISYLSILIKLSQNPD